MSISKAELATINDIINSELPTKPLSTLTIGRMYIIQAMSIENTQYGKAILVTLEDESEKVTFKTWLPKRITNQLTENQVCGINSFPKKYSLTYMGRSPAALPGTRTRALVCFNFIE